MVMQELEGINKKNEKFTIQFSRKIQDLDQD